jgi:hypothetical protein
MVADLRYSMDKIKSAMREQNKSLKSVRYLHRDNQALLDELSRNRELSDDRKGR